ncbi:DUF4352 domain-containing protein [Staphylococcus simulans]|uniref:DUF4352 domain-containing protein n=1 Tax=Staphylococcus simulans TaxID=1286 RepID=UPI001F53F0CB|nr:DUF4352 domain-containing protein [Staphylococcus simulans]UXR29392.1 DUF4352 domain-containing protein [Staphylococcus simulans]UXR34330.1 DUF4352 domain-containing protein [Staphylococcus simulans]UXR36996.1 DUF4352 domain-containing protein [Staphylococcus simulans]
MKNLSDEKELTNEELLERQQQQFEQYKKEQSAKSKKKWLWGCGGCLGLLLLIVVGVTACTGAFVNEVDKGINEEGTLNKDKNTKIKTVGETTEIDGVSFTLDNAAYTEERNEFADVQADKVLKVDMTVKNNSKKEIPVGGDVKVYVDGKQAKSYPINNQLMDSLSPNREISGSEGFAINGNPEKIELEFQPLTSFSNKRYIYDIKPE